MCQLSPLLQGHVQGGHSRTQAETDNATFKCFQKNAVVLGRIPTQSVGRWKNMEKYNQEDFMSQSKEVVPSTCAHVLLEEA